MVIKIKKQKIKKFRHSKRNKIKSRDNLIIQDRTKNEFDSTVDNEKFKKSKNVQKLDTSIVI